MRHTLSDRFRIQDYTDNWNLLDSFPGVFVCTSGTRPGDWGAPQTGLIIFETDTTLLWYWTGSAFVRVSPKGLIGHEEITTNFETIETTYQTVLTVNVTVAAGDRRHLIVVEGPGVQNTNGLTLLALWRGATLLQEWKEQGSGGSGATTQARPLAMSTTDAPSAGAEVYTLQVKADAVIGGTVTLQAGANKSLALSVIEV